RWDLLAGGNLTPVKRASCAAMRVWQEAQYYGASRLRTRSITERKSTVVITPSEEKLHVLKSPEDDLSWLVRAVLRVTSYVTIKTRGRLDAGSLNSKRSAEDAPLGLRRRGASGKEYPDYRAAESLSAQVGHQGGDSATLEESVRSVDSYKEPDTLWLLLFYQRLAASLGATASIGILEQKLESASKSDEFISLSAFMLLLTLEMTFDNLLNTQAFGTGAALNAVAVIPPCDAVTDGTTGYTSRSVNYQASRHRLMIARPLGDLRVRSYWRASETVGGGLDGSRFSGSLRPARAPSGESCDDEPPEACAAPLERSMRNLRCLWGSLGDACASEEVLGVIESANSSSISHFPIPPNRRRHARGSRVKDAT
ncbi:hypothetical protein EV715DRAFT_268610, partial [Schizophyllum commune]